ncbi:MAG: 2'-5' RNA ligase family protein [Acidiferrobacterales bacterium]
MSEIRRYSLWLLPDDTAAESFAAIIGDLSDQYHGPRFTPHVTLLGWVTGPEDDLAERTKRLAEQAHALPLRAQALASEAYYFRCFYLKLEETAELLQLHEQASELFRGGYASGYLPHLSLIYGHLPPAEKARLRRQVHDNLPTEFTADRIQLIRITVSVQDWRAVVSCPLKA